jgi:hypothetical protein
MIFQVMKLVFEMAELRMYAPMWPQQLQTKWNLQNRLFL